MSLGGWAAGPGKLTLAAGYSESFWFPGQSSSLAGQVDWLFYFILGVSAFFFLLIFSLLVFFVVRYRRRPGVTSGPSPDHNLALELVWTLVPIATVSVIFYLGVRLFLDLRVTPANAYEINVTGQKWKWLFTYNSGHVDEELHVPVDTNVHLVMNSVDVIHGLYIPAFRVQQNVVPGRYTDLWFRATRAGEFPLLCNQYCGKEHSNMATQIVVHPTGEFERWLVDVENLAAQLPPAELGKKLYRTRGCSACHSSDGSAGTGPTWKGIYGRPELVRADGRESPVTVDENYIRESIQDPLAKVVAGFYPSMPTYKGRLKDSEITALVEFIKSLRDQP